MLDSGFFYDSVFIGVFLTLGSFFAADALKRKIKLNILNPLLLSIIFVMLFLSFMNIDYDRYYEGARYIDYFLTPATVALAVPLYEKMEILRKNLKAVIAGVLAGVAAALCSIFIMSVIFSIDSDMYLTCLPKSITAAIGMPLSSELGGCPSVTVALIAVTGILGNMTAEWFCRVFHITSPVAKGLAIGAASHAMGTARAMEMGRVEGAMSSLSLALSGIITVFAVMLFKGLI